jgi:NDP-sugar pyrophosphorylase family protein
MIKSGAKLGGVVIDDGHWWDLGNREQYLAVHREIAAGTPLLASGISPLTHPAPWIAPGAMVAGSAQLTGATAIGPDARIGDGAVLHDTVVWPGATVAAGAKLSRCVVTAGVEVSGTHVDEDLANGSLAAV